MANEDVVLDNMFIASLVIDLIQGMIYLHESPIGYHANLKTANCLVDSRWVLKISDFGLQVIFICTETDYMYKTVTSAFLPIIP